MSLQNLRKVARLLLGFIGTWFRSRNDLALENLALRQQLAATARGISLRQRAAVSGLRPGFHLQRLCGRHSQVLRHQIRAHILAQPLAKRRGRKMDRQLSPGIAGSRYRLQRTPRPKAAVRIHRLLQRRPLPLRAGQRCAERTVRARAILENRAGCRNAQNRRIAPSLRVAQRGVASGGQRQSAGIFFADAVVRAGSRFPGCDCAMSGFPDHCDHPCWPISTFKERNVGSLVLIQRPNHARSNFGERQPAGKHEFTLNVVGRNENRIIIVTIRPFKSHDIDETF